MEGSVRVTAIVGTYRKGGVVDTAVDEILSAAEAQGARVSKIYLLDRRIEFCTNCRECTQLEGKGRGNCRIADDMDSVLGEVERSDAIVLASPMNCGTVTALMKRFVERLVCFAWWPWGRPAPKVRDARRTRRAVVVASSAAPALLARLSTRMVRLLKQAGGLLGARTVGVLFVGLAAGRRDQEIGEGARRRARRLGRRLVSGGARRKARTAG